LARTRPVRSVIAAVLAGVLLASCSAIDYDLEQSERSRQPIPSALMAQMNKKGMKPSDPILVRLYKQESELELWKRDSTGRYALLKTYPICRWSGRLGPKTRDGDRQAPEGFYSVARHQMNPDSRYYLSFNLGYPNRLEDALGYSGGALMIHGACSSSGCYAVTDEAAAEIYLVARDAFRAGQQAFQVQALPFRMTPQNLALHRNDPNMPFWTTLKEGNDHFEVTRSEPKVGVCGGRYVFNGTDMDGLSPLAPCPALGVPPSLSAAVAAKDARDRAQAAAIVAAGVPLPAMSYMDGGMHESFRAVLARSGPERLARMTSEKAPVSRPEAALADPFDPDMLASIPVPAAAGAPASDAAGPVGYWP
jgi:murein L,D-transpeptidase YafK